MEMYNLALTDCYIMNKLAAIFILVIIYEQQMLCTLSPC